MLSATALLLHRAFPWDGDGVWGHASEGCTRSRLACREVLAVEQYMYRLLLLGDVGLLLFYLLMELSQLLMSRINLSSTKVFVTARWR